MKHICPCHCPTDLESKRFNAKTVKPRLLLRKLVASDAAKSISQHYFGSNPNLFVKLKVTLI